MMQQNPIQRTLLETVTSLRSLIRAANRDPGDIRRNAALWLARRAGTQHSSFELASVVTVDETLLEELPYVAALGYVAQLEGFASVDSSVLVDSLQRLAGRSAHTIERTGYADDPLCACGLLLLAMALNQSELAGRIRTAVTSSFPSNPLLRVLVCAATGDMPPSRVLLSEGCAPDLAAAVIAVRIDPKMSQSLFAGLSSRPDDQLLASVVVGQYYPTVDLAGMGLLAALEAVFPLSVDVVPDVDAPCDLAVVVALKEEFRILFARISDHAAHVTDEGRAYYVFELPSLGSSRPYRCVATLIGDMGTTRSAVIAERVRRRWNPLLTTIVGIAAGIHDDVRLGDVIVATQVNNYLEAGKVTDGDGRPDFRTANDSFKADSELVELAKNFEFSNPGGFRRWRDAAELRRKNLPDSVTSLARQGLIRDVPQQKEGHLASGPLVVASKEFTSSIRSWDRSTLGLEMEAAGLMLVSHMAPANHRAIVIRGVSDFGDDRKSAIDGVGDGVLRQYAMANAVDFLWVLIESGILPRHDSSATG